MSTSVVLLVSVKLILDAQYWTKPLFLITGVSVVSYFAFALIYGVILPDKNQVRPYMFVIACDPFVRPPTKVQSTRRTSFSRRVCVC